MSEGVKPNPDSPEQQQLTREVLAEIASTGKSEGYGNRVFEWMILRDAVRQIDELRRIFPEASTDFIAAKGADEKFRTLDRQLRMKFGIEGRHQVAMAMISVIERVREAEMAPFA